jgi:hypothetical protein
MSAQLARLGNLTELEKCRSQVGRRLQAVFGLVGTLAFVSIHRFLEKAIGLLQVPQTSVRTSKPLHRQQCRLVVPSQVIGATRQNVLEVRGSLSKSAEPLKAEPEKSFGGKRVRVIRTHMKSEVRHDIAPQLERFIEST